MPRVKRIAGGSGVPSCSELGEGHVDIDVLDQTMIELPGVTEPRNIATWSVVHIADSHVVMLARPEETAKLSAKATKRGQ